MFSGNTCRKTNIFSEILLIQKNMLNKKSFMAALCITLLCNAPMNAQSGYAYTEKKDSLFSETLQENRSLSIYLPEGYIKDSTRYPAIYIIDGETRCTHAVPTIRFISAEGLMPKSIVVGIPNVNRNRDFLPAVSPNPAATDSADNFLHFIVAELFPYIEKNYRAGNYRMLIGHSYGGLFAMHALISQPDAFGAFIMIDPSFWYGSKMMITRAGAFFSRQKTLPKSIYIAGVDGNAWYFMGNHDMDSVLKATAPVGLQWKTFAYANENHGSVPFKSIYDGLRFVFSDYSSNIGDLIPAKGIMVKDKPYDVSLFTRLKTLYYTTDGTRPGAGSSMLKADTTGKAVIHIDKPCTLNIVASPRYEAARMITGEYKAGSPFEAVKEPIKLSNGLRYKAYEGIWDSLPDFSKLKPYATGTVKNFVFPDSARKDNFGVQYDGYLFAAEEGYYDVELNSDDGSRLFINNEPLLDNDGLHAAGSWKAFRIYLKKGYHIIHVDFFEKTGDEVLELEFLKYPWTVEPDGKIPDELLFHAE
jgi:predicted alpha/beta superfamily hydrolase